jgi:hypothetical protein
LAAPAARRRDETDSRARGAIATVAGWTKLFATGARLYRNDYVAMPRRVREVPDAS